MEEGLSRSVVFRQLADDPVQLMVLRPRDMDLLGQRQREDQLLHCLLSEIGREMIVRTHVRRTVQRLGCKAQM